MAGQTATQPQSQQQLQAEQQAQNARAQILGVNAKTVAFAAALWASYPRHNDAAMASFLQKWLPTLRGAEQAIGQITQSYLTTLIQTIEGNTYAVNPVPSGLFTGSVLRNGADPSEVYQRPFVQLHADLAQKKPVDQALASAQARLKAMASTDMQLANTHAARATFQQIPEGQKITGYRRVIGDDDPCELCVQAASQRYKASDLMPIHVRCNCTVWPIVGRKDLGQYVNVVTLANNPPSADDTKFFGQTVIVHQHGEYGPVLTAGGDSFMTQSQAMARTATV
jgi:hypothetical protein